MAIMLYSSGDRALISHSVATCGAPVRSPLRSCTLVRRSPPAGEHLTRAPGLVSRGARLYLVAMSRLPLVDPDSSGTDPLAAQVLRQVTGLRGRAVPANVYRAVANHPAALQRMVEFGTVVYFNNSMTPAQRELAYLTASLTNDCHY